MWARAREEGEVRGAALGVRLGVAACEEGRRVVLPDPVVVRVKEEKKEGKRRVYIVCTLAVPPLAFADGPVDGSEYLCCGS